MLNGTVAFEAPLERVGSMEKYLEPSHHGKNQSNLTLNREKVPNVVLVGATGSGKSTLARNLARILGFGLLDLDEWIEKRVGRKIFEIFADEGEPRFRELEGEAIRAISAARNHVIVTGAGIVESLDNWRALKTLGAVVWVATPIDEIANRLLMSPDQLRGRPLLADAVLIEDKETRRQFLRKKLADLLERRLERYLEADCILEDRYSTPEVSAQIIKALLVKLGAPQSDDSRL